MAARRRALGHSQESLAELLEVRPQSVARWEQGTSTPLARYRRPLAELLELSLPQLEHLIANGDGSPALQDPVVVGWMDHYTSLEQGAAKLETFEPIVIPGLLQTEAYATAVMRASHVPLSDYTIQDRVRMRLARQRVLERAPHPLTLVCVVDESVLHRVTGGPETMARQLDPLVQMSRRPSITIQIVPVQCGALHCAAFGSFRLFTAPGADAPFMTCTEDLTGFNYLDRRPEIDSHAGLFAHLSTVALSPAESTQLIQTTAEQYR